MNSDWLLFPALTFIQNKCAFLIWHTFVNVRRMLITRETAGLLENLISWNFLDSFISRFRGAHISRHVYSAILHGKLLHFEALKLLRFWVPLSLFPWQFYFNMSLNLVGRIYQRYNNVKINKNTTAGLHVNSNIMWVFFSRHFMFPSLKFSDLF